MAERGSRLVKLGRPAGNGVSVNPPVHRASTFVFDTLDAFDAVARKPFDSPFYGRVGTPTGFAFEEAMADLEGGYRAIAYPSGLAAITAVLFAYLSAGDHVLIVDTAYGPTRRTADRTLGRMGVEASYYDPAIGAGIAALIRPNTRLIMLESPGSGTFEMQDIPAIVAVAKAHGIVTAIDNTWATPLFLQPLAMGVDVSIHAATKYITGHSDAMLGVATVNNERHDDLRRATQDLGMVAGSEEVNLGLRGLRTLQTRLLRHQASALTVAEWLAAHPAVGRVFYPALLGAPGHDLWKRDYSGASGLFSIELPRMDAPALARFVDGMTYFKIGFSWGGYESLALPAHPETRQHPVWAGNGPVLRLHIGLEEPDDLIADLEAGLARANGGT